MQQCRYQLSAMLSISSENLIVQSQLIFININVLTFILLQIVFANIFLLYLYLHKFDLSWATSLHIDEELA